MHKNAGKQQQQQLENDAVSALSRTVECCLTADDQAWSRTSGWRYLQYWAGFQTSDSQPLNRNAALTGGEPVPPYTSVSNLSPSSSSFLENIVQTAGYQLLLPLLSQHRPAAHGYARHAVIARLIALLRRRRRAISVCVTFTHRTLRSRALIDDALHTVSASSYR